MASAVPATMGERGGRKAQGRDNGKRANHWLHWFFLHRHASATRE
jgi:hypothetical protein